MPIVMDENSSNVSVVDIKGSKKSMPSQFYSPKFFNKSILTGKGGQSRGILNENNDPKMHVNGYPARIKPDLELGTHYNKDIKIYDIPCFIIPPALWDYINKIERPELGAMTKIAAKKDKEIYLQMPIHALQIEEETITSNGNTTTTSTTRRTLSACMRIFLYVIDNKTVTEHTRATSIEGIALSTDNKYYTAVVDNMFNELRTVESILSHHGYTVDRAVMDNFLQSYSLYDELCKAAERWLTQTDYYINDVLIKNINDYTNGDPVSDLWTRPASSVYDALSRLEKYSVPLDQYQSMYGKMVNTVNNDILSLICKANLNLRLSNTLRNMNQNRALLQSCPCNNHIQSKIPFSIEQREAIESTSPLTLVQSGAGTGKSTVILGRIDHMIANGVDPKDITVLSFTNAAANHIIDLKPSIHSLTIASMLHTIYSNNFPTHQLSSLSTIINSLDIYFNPVTSAMTIQQTEFIDRFKRVLTRLRDHNEYTRANNFVEDHIDEVINTLNTIQQTSLELESIICYQKMDTLVEPPETQTKHLIIDEVQDNSIAEFIYSIKYTDKHHCSMYIVGDCSQTLYEFRSSNPKALNVLENSGVFETHKLQTNYRSNQEILDFANVLLGTIEANQYANIQLKANSLKPVTSKSFKDAVTLCYDRLPNKSNSTIDGMIAHSISVDARQYIDDKLNKKEQVCILAPVRNTLSLVEKYLRTAYPDKKIVSLVPKRSYDSDIFSKFIANCWDKITYVPPTSLTTTIRRELAARIPYIVYKKANTQKVYDMAMQMFDEFEKAHGADITNWQNQVMMSVMTQAQLLGEVKKLLIAFEIKRNSVAQALISSRNAEAKKADDISDADFILSTIHSAKGLEFDNVIVYYQSESNMDEPSKRMYYVAFTRAKKTEFIFAYDTLARPKIQGDYEKIIKTLTAKDKAAGLIPDADPAPTEHMSASNMPIAIPKELLASSDDDEDSEDNEDKASVSANN